MSEVRARDWVAAGREALRRNEPGKAVKAFDRALSLVPDRPRVRVLRARALGRCGQREQARAALVEVVRGAAIEARVDAAVVLAELGDEADATRIALDVLGEEPAHRGALELVGAYGARIGWTREACAAMEALVAGSSGVAMRVHAALLYESLRDLPRALAHAEAARKLDAGSVEAALVVARVAARSGRWRDAREAGERAAELAGHEPSRLLEAARALVEAGAPERAAVAFRRVLDLRPGDAEALGWLAEIALWRGQLDEAESLATQALASDAKSARAHAVKGGALVMRGELEAAIPLLRAAIDADPSEVAARHFLGEALRRLERWDQALEALDLAVIHALRYAATAHASRVLSVLEQSPHQHRLEPDVHAELVETLAPLAGEPPDAVRAGEPDAVHAFLSRGLEALAGNRGDTPTRLVSGGLEGVAIRTNSRTACRYLQESLRTRDAEEVLAGFPALVSEYGDLPTIHCHHGEVLLWLGRYAEGEACFERAIAIDPKTRWAWIGLGASRVLGGDLEGAARAFADALVHAPPPGRTIYVYRGELALRRGELGAARADLEHALHINPERVSAMLMMAVVEAREGDAGAAGSWIARAREAAPALFASAGDLAGLRAEETAERLLAMKRGNRSAGFVTYFTAAGAMRFVPPPEVLVVRHDPAPA